MPASSPLATYLADHAGKPLDPSLVAYIASLEQVAKVSPTVAQAIVGELRDQRANLKLIASENYSSLATQLAMGNLLTDKYAEGVAHHRFYAGCDNVDTVESLAAAEACALFGADHAYVQPHSGADANLVAYWAILAKYVQTPAMEKLGKTDLNALSDAEWADLRSALGNQRLLGMDLYAGGHLTHGYRMNVSARMFEAQTYGVDPETGLLDYEAIRKQAKAFKPLVLLAGFSAYPRKINFRIFREIADEIGAVLMVDMAHFAGLVAGKVFTGDFDPVAYADIVTTTTHKTLRGPRGGLVLCKQPLAEFVDKGCPMVLGGPLPHVIAAKAVALGEARDTTFGDYAKRIVENAQALAAACVEEGMRVLTGGTENHLLLIDVTPFGLNGRQAESAVRAAGITLNKNAIPGDPNGPWYTSGLRVGTPAVTTLGMGKAEMKTIAKALKLILAATKPGEKSKAKFVTDEKALAEAKALTSGLLAKFPVYPELDLEFLEKAFEV